MIVYTYRCFRIGWQESLADLAVHSIQLILYFIQLLNLDNFTIAGLEVTARYVLAFSITPVPQFLCLFKLLY
uniref:Uncharacterized protein n=1 Tax=Pararge aegeria TaxID=116150 RepID=S4PAT8_9NEOP